MKTARWRSIAKGLFIAHSVLFFASPCLIFPWDEHRWPSQTAILCSEYPPLAVLSDVVPVIQIVLIVGCTLLLRCHVVWRLVAAAPCAAIWWAFWISPWQGDWLSSILVPSSFGTFNATRFLLRTACACLVLLGAMRSCGWRLERVAPGPQSVTTQFSLAAMMVATAILCFFIGTLEWLRPVLASSDVVLWSDETWHLYHRAAEARHWLMGTTVALVGVGTFWATLIRGFPVHYVAGVTAAIPLLAVYVSNVAASDVRAWKPSFELGFALEVLDLPLKYWNCL